MQSPPRARTGDRQLGGEVLLGLGHLMFGPCSQAHERSVVLGDGVAQRGQFVDTE